jgi:hypothetical protein
VDGTYASARERWRHFNESRGAALLAAWLGGFGVASTFVVLSSHIDNLWVPFTALVIGLVWLSVWFRHFGSIIGAMIAAWLWQPIFTAHHPPSYADMMAIDFARDGLVAFIGIVTPVFAHAGSLLFRRHPGRKHGVRIALGLGLASILAFSASELVQAQVPTSQSFAVSVPGGWTSYDPATAPGDTVRVMYGADYFAIEGDTNPVSDLSRPPAPMLRITVFAVQPGSDGSMRCNIWPGQADWTYRASRQVDWKPPDVSAADADLSASLNDSGDSFFVLEAPRTRQVGVVVQHLCYLMVVSVPATSGLSRSDIDALFSSFRYR